MTDPETPDSASRYGGDRRAKDRRKSDRRQEGRRAPPPPWRRPSAFVAYGVVVTLVLVALLTGEDESVAEFPGGSGPGSTAVAASPIPQAAPGSTIRQAFSVAEFERLVAEGDAAVGAIVQAELFCGSIAPMALRQIEGIDPALSALADADNRVPAAECRWSREARSSDFLLVVPPDLAVEFASGPEVELNFVRRRRVAADVYWLGRSEGLALRMAGILTDVRTPR